MIITTHAKAQRLQTAPAGEFFPQWHCHIPHPDGAIDETFEAATLQDVRALILFYYGPFDLARAIITRED